MTTDPDKYTHAFQTFLGIPPTKGQAPVCGAVLTDAYDFPGTERPVCPACHKIVLGNKVRQEGCDRCANCGCKYWENDRCIDCGSQEVAE